MAYIVPEYYSFGDIDFKMVSLVTHAVQKLCSKFELSVDFPFLSCADGQQYADLMTLYVLVIWHFMGAILVQSLRL